jgi:hypothetical protein
LGSALFTTVSTMKNEAVGTLRVVLGRIKSSDINGREYDVVSGGELRSSLPALAEVTMITTAASSMRIVFAATRMLAYARSRPAFSMFSPPVLEV